MAAVAAVRSLCEHSHDNGHLQRKIPQRKIGLDDIVDPGCCMWATRRRAWSCMQRDLEMEKVTPHSSQVQRLEQLGNIKAILDSLDAVVYDIAGPTDFPHLDPPPSYNDSLAGEPPNYDCVADLPLAQAVRCYPVPPPPYFYRSTKSGVTPDQMTTPDTSLDIDFADTSDFREVGNKKKEKQQKKQADAAKWNDDGGEGNTEGGEGGEDNGGGGAGGGSNGDGGAGDDGGGGGDDWWDTGKKKGKKAKEEEKKKQEEEEEEKEKKRKEEEEANANGKLDWADDANGDVGNDWGGWDTGKKKKGKKAKDEEKKKQEEEEENEENEANGNGKLDWVDDANEDVNNNWADFTTATAKKGKKDKKGKIEPAANVTDEFADINLNDAVPKIDLSFGPTDTKSGGGFGRFGEWGGGGSAWNTGSNWNFSGVDTETTDIADSFSRATKDSMTETTDSNTWSFGGNKKNQKKKTTNGFDSFNFGALNEEGEDEKAEEDKAGVNNSWGAFMDAGKKEKKSKKKSPFDLLSNDPDPDTIGTALADPESAAGDSWNAWGDTSKKKKGKKGEEMPTVLPPVAAAHAPTEPAADEWAGLGTKKGGKKGKKVVEVDESIAAAAPEPASIPDPEPDAAWSVFGRKEKRKAKKEADKAEDPALTVVPEAAPDFDFGKGPFGKKDKKKIGKKEPETVEQPEIAALPDPDPQLDLGFSSFGKKDDKKGKKGKKESEQEEESISAALQEPEANTDFGFGSWGKKDDKKGKKGKKELEKAEEQPKITLPATEPDLEVDFGFGSFGKKEDKKGKKGKKEDKSEDAAITTVPEPEPEADIGWGSFAKKDARKKVGKKGVDKTEDMAAKEENPDINNWASLGTKKDKDKKKAKKFDPWDEPEEEVEEEEDEEGKEVEETPEPDIDAAWGAFSSKKDKKKGKKDIMEETESVRPEPVIDEKPNLLRSGSTKGKKGKKGLISEVEEDPVPAVGSHFAFDATSVAANDDWTKNFGADKKKDKKVKRGSLASTGSKADEAPTPPPPVPEVPEASSFDKWNSIIKDKDKKGKKSKVPEPDFFPTPEHEGTKEVVQDDWIDWANLSPKERRKKEKEKKDREAKEAREREEAEENERKEREEAEERERKEKEEAEEREREEKEEAEEREREEKEKKGKDKAKGKLGKKGKAGTSPEASKTKNLLADSIPDVAPVVEEDTWAPTWGGGPFSKDVKKGGKKGMLWEAPPPAPTPPAMGLTPEPEEDAEEDVLDDNLGDYPPAKTSAKGKKDAKEDLKAGKKGVKDKVEGVLDEKAKKAGKDEGKKKDGLKEESAAKAAKNFWSGMGTTAASKSKVSAKDKEKEKAAKEAKEKEEEEEDEDEDEEDYDEEMEDVVEEEAPTMQTAKIGKIWGGSTKDSDKAKGNSAGKMKKGKLKGFDGEEKDMEQEANQDDEGKVMNRVAFSPSTWASASASTSAAKKTTGKKTADELWGKKEIGPKDSTNQTPATGAKQVSNEPEATEQDDQPWTSQPSKSTKSTIMSTSTSKANKTSSVLQRVKEIEKEKNKLSEPLPPVLDPEPTTKFDKSQPGASTKAKNLSSSKNVASKSKDLTSQFNLNSNSKKKPTKEEAVPGSFPGEAMDDDFNTLDDLLQEEAPLEKKESKKSNKSIKDSNLTSKTRGPPEVQQPPTPPPEIKPEIKPEVKEEKPVKKERPRIAKEGNMSSWGLWGPAPPRKKETKSKDDADILSPTKKEKAATPGFTRSKSTRTAKEKDKATVKSDSKSSDSDKPKKMESRPPKSRGSSFGGLFGPPVRTKSVRKNSTAASNPKSASSRRQSVDVDTTGLPSPPAEEAPEMASKAAKMMGTAKLDRKASTRGKQKAPGTKVPVILENPLEIADSGDVAVPDPYAIDSDDMVMVNEMDDAIPNGKEASPTKNVSSNNRSKGMDAEPASSLNKDLPDRTKSRRDSKMDSNSSKRKSKIGNDFDDDVVMVDAGSSGDGAVEPGPDDMQFITKPKGFQRPVTNSKRTESKSSGLGGGLFGAFRRNRRATEANEPPKSRAIVEDKETAPRKRTVTGGDDSAKRPRRDDRRKPDKVDRAAEGYVYDTVRDVGGATEPEDVDARREKRRAKRADEDRVAMEQREEALRYEADRRSKRREADKAKHKDDRDRRARRDEEAEVRRAEDRDREERRAAREARRRDDEANRALEDDILKPRSKRRESEKEVPAATSSRPRTSDRHRSHMDKAAERPKSSRRKSTMPPVDDYFDPHNAGAVNENDPYSGNDHTTSWVQSQASDPPEPPPVEPTIMEPAPDFRSKGAADDLMEDEYVRRASHKKPKRSSRMYTDPLGDEQEERRRRRKEKEVRSSEGSAAEERFGGLGSMNRRPSDLGGVKLGAGSKTFDGKTGQGRRSSWFQKVTGGF